MVIPNVILLSTEAMMILRERQKQIHTSCLIFLAESHPQIFNRLSNGVVHMVVINAMSTTFVRSVLPVRMLTSLCA